ncbi:hypothetical protein EG340_18060 [Chryseobacterium indoltheticum]|uniref:Uncharacterized protein n=1 Tax=Chryseobacterium indoltheticum TaxID=254 RepID=A0A3G6NB16_9FLAO|nr:hypothetical protein EG340_18060 [Chryseobacterium indoltheticum]
MMFSFMDGGNAMWGVWMRSLGMTNYEIRLSSHTQEFIRSFGRETDTPADQRSIFYFKYFRQKKIT